MMRIPQLAWSCLLGLISLGSVQSQTCAPAPAGLVAWFRAEGDAQSLLGGISSDSTGLTFIGGRAGQGFLFDAPGAGIDLGTPTFLNVQEFTVETWIRRTATNAVASDGSSIGWILSRGGYGFGFGLRDDGRLIHVGPGNTVPTVSTVPITDTGFHHVALIRSGATVRFVIDGMEAGVEVRPEWLGYGGGTVLGRSATDGTGSFRGVLDELAIFDRPLSVEEVAAIHAAGESGKCIPAPDVANDIAIGTERLIQGSVATGHLSVTSDGFSNDGVLRLESRQGSFLSGLTVEPGAITNRADGEILIRPGSGGSRELNTSILNDGLWSITHPLSVNRAHGRIIQRGDLDLSGSGSLTLTGTGLRLDLVDGTVTGGSRLTGNGIHLRYLGGSLEGAPILVNSRLEIDPSNNVPGTFYLTGSGSALVGELQTGHQVILGGSSAGSSSTIQAPTGLRLGGLLRLESRNSSFNSALQVSGGPLEIRPGGEFRSVSGTGGTRTLTAQLVNDGVFNVTRSLAFSASGGDHINRGEIRIPSGETLTLTGVGQGFLQEAGAIRASGQFDMTGMRFEYRAGELEGTLYLTQTDLRLEPVGSDPINLILSGSNSRLRGWLNPGQSLWIRGDARGSSTTVLAPEGFTNRGSLRLESANSSYSTHLTVTGDFLNAQGGTLLVRPGNGGTRVLSAEVRNEGTINLQTSTTVGRTDAIHRNRGTWTVNSGATLQISGAGQTFQQETGLLDLAGAGDFTNIDFRYEGGEIRGVPYLDGSRLVIGAGTGPVEFVMTRNGSQIEGNIGAGQSVRVQGSSRGSSTTLLAPRGLTNSGTLILQSANSSYLTGLTVDGGALVNRPEGLLRVGAGTGGPRTITAELQNEGEFRVAQSLTLVRPGVTHVNRGRFIIDPGNSLNVSGQGQVFRQEAGLLEINGGADLTGIRFEYLGGDIVGTPYLDSVRLTLGSDAVRPASFILGRTGSEIRGVLKPDQTIWIRADSRVSSTVVSAPEGFTNAGVLRIEAVNSGYTAGFNSGSNGLLNLPGGRIWIRPGAGGPRPLTGPLVNQGTVDAEQTFTLGPAGTVHRNAGEFTLASGETLTFPGASQRFIQEAGTLRVLGSLQLDNDTFRYAGGQVEGSLLLSDSRLELPASAGPTGTFLFRGNGVLTGSVPAQVRVVLEGSAAGNNGLLTLPSGLVNAGRLTLLTRNSTYSAQVNSTAAPLINAPSGILETLPGTGGSRRIQAALVNRGLLDLQISTRIGLPNEGVLSEGRILIHPGVTLTLDGPLQLNRGRLDGAGIIAGTVVSDAITAPGPGVATLQINGPWRQGPRGILDLEIGPGSNDRLRVTGRLELGGMVRVRLLPGHTPVAGARHVLIDGPAPVGRPMLDLPPLPEGLGWQADYTAGLALNVVELPEADPSIGVAGRVTGPDDLPLAGVPVQILDNDPRGLLAEYWNGTNHLGPPILARVESTLEQRWGNTTPGSGVTKPFTSRWTGTLIPDHTETYQLITTSDDGIRLWIDDTLWIDHWTPHTATTNRAEIAFTAGQRYAIRVEHFDISGPAVAVLEWSSPSQPRAVIPQSALRAPANAPVNSLRQWTVRTDADGRYQAAVPPGNWAIQPVGWIDLGFRPVAPHPVTVSNDVVTADFNLDPNDADRFPDLIASTPVASATAVAGSSLSVNWTVSNQGEATALAPWREVVLLGLQPSGFGAVEVGRFDVTTDLAPGAAVERSLTVNIPVGWTGPHHLLVRVDSGLAVDERDGEDNNLSAARSLNLLIGDLVVDRVEAPVTGAWGESFDLTWVVRNAGGAPVQSPWTDSIYLSPFTTGGTLLTNLHPARITALAPGESHTNTLRVHLPLGAQNPPGTYHFLVRTDRTGLQTEASESNNLGASAPVNVTRPPPADLVVSRIEVPEVVEAGRPTVIRWTVRNQGLSTAIGPWRDTLALDAGSIPVATVDFNDSLEPGTEVIRSREILFPAAWAGTHTLRITTDAEDRVFETGDPANNSAISPDPFQILAPDLVPVSLTAVDASAGQPFPVEWSVRNAGNADAAGVWLDRLTLVGPAGERLLGTYPRPGTAPLGSLLTQTQALQIIVPLTPDFTPGDYRLRLDSDSRADLLESSETNNRIESALFRIGLPPLPDLTLHRITAPIGVAPGGVLPVIWELANTGAAPVPAGSVLRLDLLPEPPAIPRPLLTLRIDEALPAGASLTRTSNVIIPISSAGPVRIRALADATGEVMESDETNNQLATALPTEVSRQITWSLPVEVIPENAQPPLLRARLTRSGPLESVLGVTLTSADTNEVVLPSSVSFPIGAATVELDVQVMADGRVDGPKPTLLTADAAGFNPGYFTLTVLDADRARLTLVPETNRVVEGLSIPVILRRSEPTVDPLQINLSSSTGDLAPPATVTLPAGASEVAFALIATENDRLESSRLVLLTAEAEEHLSSAVEITVLDNDDPGLVLAIAPTQIGEGDGPLAATATLTRSQGIGRLLRVRVSASNDGRLVVPPEIVFAPGQSTVSFYAGPVDDRINNGPAEVLVTASVMAPVSGEILATSAPVTVRVEDDDGASLRLSLGTTVSREGRSPAFTAVVLRNSPVNQPLTVQLTVSDPTEAAVPESVVIPAGQTSVTFPVTTLEDGQIDGNQPVTLSATAIQHAPATALFTVTDGNLPDLAFAQVTVSASGITGGEGVISWRLINQGFAPARGPFTQRLHFSRDNLLDAADVLIEESVFSGTLQPGESIERNLTRRLPSETGEWRVIAVADASGAVEEVLESNNLAFAGNLLRVDPAYTATVSTSIDVAPAGTAIPLTGRALKPDGTPAPAEWVRIHVRVRETERSLSALTDAEGRFETVFQPVAGEFGQYAISAGHPGAPAPAAQDQFELIGLRLDPVYQFTRVVPGRTNLLRVQLTNPNARSMTGLQFNAGAVDDLGVAVEGPLELAPGESGAVVLRVWSRADRDAVGRFTVRMTSGEGARMDAVIDYTVELPQPRLVSRPTRLDSGVVRGSQATVEFEVINQGGADSGPLDVTLPDLPWMRVASALPLPSLAPGESVQVTLALTPDETLALGLHEGRLAVGNDTGRVTVPFSIRHVSEALGDVRVPVHDENTYYGNGSLVAGAAVVLRDVYDNSPVISSTTDTQGVVLFTDVPEGTYNLEVTAPRHDNFLRTIQVGPGRVNETVAFLRTQLVRYNWRVEEVDFEERARIQLDTIFETTVPVPVVTIEPALIDLTGITTDTHTIELKVSNQGLIAVQDVDLRFEDGSTWRVNPLATDLGAIPPRSSISVPVTFTRITNPAAPGRNAAPAAGPTGAGCSPPSVGVGWELLCGPFGVAYWSPVFVVDLGLCPPPPPSGPGRSQGQLYIPQFPHVPTPGGGSTFPINIGFGPSGFTSFAGTNDCSCDPERFVPKCASAEAGYKADASAAARGVLNAVLGPVKWLSVQGFEVKFGGSAKLCTCCEEVNGQGVTGLKAEAELGGAIEVKLFAGPQFQVDVPEVNFPGLTDAKAEMFLGAGVELTGTGSVKVQASTECFLAKPKVYVDARIRIGTPIGLKGTGKVTGTLADGTAVELSAEAFGGVDLGAYAYFSGYLVGGDGSEPTRDGCIEPIVVRAELKVSAGSGPNSIGGGASVTREMTEKICLIETSPNSLPRFTPLTEAEAVSRMLGFSSPAELAVGVTHQPDAADSLAAQPTPRELSDTLVRHLGLPTRIATTAAPIPVFSQTYTAAPVADAAAQQAAAARQTGRNARVAAATDGVCAQVKLVIEQQAVVTRKGIGATLEIINESTDTPLEDIGVAIQIQDRFGNPANDRFIILPPELTRLQPMGQPPTNQLILGGLALTLPADSTGSARWLIVPRDTAAPDEPVDYFVGGHLAYRSGDITRTAELIPGTVTVHPNARLFLKYFHQRDVFADDPFTDVIEPSEPFVLGVMVENRGRGIARNFSITSAQPRIVDNAKGLLVHFDILAAQVAGRPVSPSLTVGFGDVGPGTISIGRWLLQSSIQGLFLDYSATLEHEDRFGERGASVFEGVEIHELIRQVEADRTHSDGQPDFLVNDAADPDDLPDTLHLSDGSTRPVAVVREAIAEGTPVADDLEVDITAVTPPGWVYLRIPDPARGQFALREVRRPDGSILHAPTNAWITDRTFIGQGRRPLLEHTLHLLDHDSPGRYTLVYQRDESLPDTIAPTSQVSALSETSPALIPVRWSGSDDAQGSGIESFDVFVSIDGGGFQRWLDGVRTVSAFYPGAAGRRYAFYSVARDVAGNVEAAPGTPDTATVATGNSAPVLAPVADVTVDEGARIDLTLRATDLDLPGDTLRFHLVSGPAGAVLDPVTGRFTWQTGEADGPSTRIVRVQVADDGEPPLTSGRDFRVTIREVNLPVTLDPVPPLFSVDEGSLFRLMLTATDPDLPANPLRYRLLAGAPAGATLNPVSGELRWTPSELQGGSSHAFEVEVTDQGNPPTTSRTAFTVSVAKVNAAPALQPIADRTVWEGDRVEILLQASDTDLPVQTLVFRLEQGGDLGATLHPQSGLFTWIPEEQHANATNRFSVAVTDSGEPALGAQRSFQIVVRPLRPGLNLPDRASDGTVSFRYKGRPGVRAALEASIDLRGWTELSEFIPDAPVEHLVERSSADFPWRYFRVIEK